MSFQIAPNPAPDPGAFASAASSSYAAGLQFATALRAAAAQHQQQLQQAQQQGLKAQMDRYLQLTKEGYTPAETVTHGERATPSTPGTFSHRDAQPGVDPSRVVSDEFGRKWVPPAPKPDASAQQTYTDQASLLKEGARPIDPQTGNVQQHTDIPRYRVDENGKVTDTGMFGINAAPENPGLVQTPPGSKTSYYPQSSDERAAQTLRQKLTEAAAMPGKMTPNTGDFSEPVMIDEKRGAVTPMTLPAGVTRNEKPEPAPKYKIENYKDEKGHVTATRMLVDGSAPPEFYNPQTKAWEPLSSSNHIGAAERPPQNTFNFPGLGGPQTPAAAQKTGDDFLQGLPPGTAATIKGIAEGRITPPSPNNRSQAAQQLLQSVMQYDPTFTTQRAQVRKAFTTGPDGKNIGALNTAIVHLGRLGDTAEALKNGSFTPGNELFNYFKDKFGSAATTNFGLLRDAVAGEMASALKGTATDVEIEKMGRSIRASNSPDQMHQVVNEGMAILKDKANTYDERYHGVVGPDQWSPILPSAKAQLDKHANPAKGGKGNPDPNAYIPGHFYGGQQYLGGDPNNPASWKAK